MCTYLMYADKYVFVFVHEGIIIFLKDEFIVEC